MLIDIMSVNCRILHNCNCSRRDKPTYRSLIAWQLIAYYNVRYGLRCHHSVAIAPREVLRKMINHKKDLPFHFITLHLTVCCAALFGFVATLLLLRKSSNLDVLASLSQAHPLRSSHSMLRTAFYTHFVSSRKLSRPCPLLGFARSGALFSLGEPRCEARSPLPTRHYSAALPLRALALLHDGQSVKLFLQKSTVYRRLFVSASLRSLVLRATLALQPQGYALLPCCCRISLLSFYDVSRETLKILFIFTALHSCKRSRILNPFTVLIISRLRNLARNLDKFSKMHLLYIIELCY